jgi:hypothetical protein
MPVTGPPSVRQENSSNGVNYRNLTIWGALVGALSLAGASLVILAAHLHGVLRYLLGAIGVAGLGLSGVSLGSVVLCCLGWGFLAGTFRDRPSVLQRCLWLCAAVIGGAALGATTYAAGPPGLVSGPLVFIAVASAIRVHSFGEAQTDRRFLGFFTILAAFTLAVGLTIFI